jgi:excinuclease ABC subunit C
MRNEAHRFGISFHRRKREKALFESELDIIKGIGEKTKERILYVIKDLKDLRSMEERDLVRIAGKRASRILLKHFASEGAIGVDNHK